MPTYRVLGIMSGSSLDGLDLALCELEVSRGRWRHSIRKARTVAYPQAMRERLLHAMQGSAMQLAQLDADLGQFIGQASKRFLRGERAELIASHGHTIFHQPKLGFSTQIGSGARIAAITGITTVCDFRSADMAAGGQGAPLVPLGENLLFPDYAAFVNLGGICNISLHGPDRIFGYDVCICNQALNFLAQETGRPFDRNGDIARSSHFDADLLADLNRLPFHQKRPPKSLGREWFEDSVLPLINDRSEPVGKRLRTVVEHIAWQLGKALKHAPGPVLVTGGGAHNRFLVERIAAQSRALLVLPPKATIDFKEALVFALLGVLRMRGEANALASVT
ncbi:MAG TPA: anhydro-N-acetylmuramic acid kinase, partial [Flavobacteriales bacterium]|nr:anhydro-N-acetylmuramic acid kinase [Flavobacteriales bacterium]